MWKTEKTLIKEIKAALSKWKDIAYSWTGRLNIVKALNLPNMVYRVNAIPIKTPANFFLYIFISLF